MNFFACRWTNEIRVNRTSIDHFWVWASGDRDEQFIEFYPKITKLALEISYCDHLFQQKYHSTFFFKLEMWMIFFSYVYLFDSTIAHETHWKWCSIYYGHGNLQMRFSSFLAYLSWGFPFHLNSVVIKVKKIPRCLRFHIQVISLWFKLISGRILFVEILQLI